MERPETHQALVAEAAPGGPGRAASEGTGPAVEACVVLSSDGSRYGMFEALSVSPEGAVLAGGLLLEVTEEVTVELRLPDRTVFRAGARVVEILHGRPPAMKVVWTGIAEGDSRRLAIRGE